MTWHNLNDAAKLIQRHAKKHGCHVFYYPERGEKGFVVKRDSRNGNYAGDEIAKNPDNYIGFYRNTGGVKVPRSELIETLVFESRKYQQKPSIRTQQSQGARW